MKRNDILAIVLFSMVLALLCISCNIDAADGIYSEVAASTVSKDIVLRSYLGTYDGVHYYLSDDGVFRDSTSTAIAKNSEGIIIRAARLDESDGSVWFLKQSASTLKATLYVSTLSGDEYSDPVSKLEGCIDLRVCGLCYDENGIYYASGTTLSSAIISDVTVNYILETDNCAFVSVKDSDDEYKFLVIKDGALELTLDGNSTKYIAFQPVGTSGEYMVMKHDSSTNTFDAFKLTASEIETTRWFRLRSSPLYYDFQAPSFYYTKDSKEYIVVKCSSYFDEYNITDNSIRSLSSGYAGLLCKTEVTNILSTDEDGVFIAGTYNSMLYKIDALNDKSSAI